jgi:hypothetical protein
MYTDIFSAHSVVVGRPTNNNILEIQMVGQATNHGAIFLCTFCAFCGKKAPYEK